MTESFDMPDAMPEFDLHCCQYAAVPDSVDQLGKVLELTPEDGQFAAEHYADDHMTAQTDNDSEGAQIPTVPHAFGLPHVMQELGLHGNQYVALQDSVDQMGTVKELSPENSQIADEPHAIDHTTAQADNSAEDDQLPAVPHAFGLPQVMQEFDSLDNQHTPRLTTMPNCPSSTWRCMSSTTGTTASPTCPVTRWPCGMCSTLRTARSPPSPTSPTG